MNAGRVFALLFSISFGLALAGAMMGPWMRGTPLEEFKPPESVYKYKAKPTGNPFGDFFWAMAQVLMWFGNLRNIASALVASFSVPYPLNVLIMTAVSASLAAFTIYIVSGRVIRV